MLADRIPTDTTLPTRGHNRHRAPAERLRAALLDLAGGLAEVAGHRERSWASITFAGTRHSIELHFAGEAAIAAGERFIEVLPDHEFAIPGQLVADAAILEVDHRIGPAPLMKIKAELLLLDEA